MYKTIITTATAFISPVDQVERVMTQGGGATVWVVGREVFLPQLEKDKGQ